MDKIHARWLIIAAIVSSAVGLVMCPAGTLVLAAVLCLLNLDMTPRALDCRMQINVIYTVLLALGLMAFLPSATIWWAVFSCPTLIWLFGRPKPDDIKRHDEAKPERPGEKKESKPKRRRRNRRTPVIVIQPPTGAQLPPQPAWDLREFSTADNRTLWR